jgi:hypothetical protein
MRKTLLGFILVLSFEIGFGQSSKLSKLFSEPIITDSSSTVIIPIRYKENIFASSKIGNDYYANIIFYNFVTDSSKSLFKDNSFIREFRSDNDYYHRYDKIDMTNNMSSKWIFYFVKEDYNKNGHIDYKDPSVLYVSDKYGNGLKPITPEDKNAISINIYDKLGFALIKIQCDSNNDRDFDSDDKEYYFVRLDLKTLTLGNKIEIKN